MSAAPVAEKDLGALEKYMTTLTRDIPGLATDNIPPIHLPSDFSIDHSSPGPHRQPPLVDALIRGHMHFATTLENMDKTIAEMSGKMDKAIRNINSLEDALQSYWADTASPDTDFMTLEEQLGLHQAELAEYDRALEEQERIGDEYDAWMKRLKYEWEIVVQKGEAQ